MRDIMQGKLGIFFFKSALTCLVAVLSGGGSVVGDHSQKA